MAIRSSQLPPALDPITNFKHSTTIHHAYQSIIMVLVSTLELIANIKYWSITYLYMIIVIMIIFETPPYDVRTWPFNALVMTTSK